MTVGFQETDSTAFPEDSGGPELAVIREVDTRAADEFRIGLDLDYVFAGRWNAGFMASYYGRDEEFASPGIAPGATDGVPPNSADTDYDRTRVLATLGTDIGDNVAALVGAEWQSEQGKSIGVIDFGFPLPADFELDRDTVSVFGEASATLGNVVLQGGLRWDDPDQIDSVVTGRLGILYKMPDGLTELRASWGQGFKAPSFFALASPIVGNASLESETGDTIDASIRRSFKNSAGFWEFGVFRNEYDDLIDFDSDLFINVNRDKVVTQGGEAAVEYAFSPELTVRAHLSYLDTEIKDSDAVLRGRPKWRGGAIMTWQFLPRWRWVASVLALDEFYESSVPTGGIWLDGYTRVDTSLTWLATDALEVALAVDNLLDEDYQEAVGFTAAGTRGRISARYKF